MKCDPDLERQIPLAIVAYDGEPQPGYADLSCLEAPNLQMKYQVVLLYEGELIQAIDAAPRRVPWPSGASASKRSGALARGPRRSASIPASRSINDAGSCRPTIEARRT